MDKTTPDTAAGTPAPQASQLWLNSRSQIEDGRGFCQRARYLNYHSGPNGYGITRRGQSLPLVAGSMAHEALAVVMRWCRDNETEILYKLDQDKLGVPREVVRAGIAAAQAIYNKAIEARGFAYMADQPEVQFVMREQHALIAGLVWAWVLEVLPEILRTSRILEVENDREIVYACTCGLGSFMGERADHDLRGCAGKALMNTPDFITQHRQSGELGYHEFKTTSMDNPTFRDKWEVMMQMITTTTEVEQRYGKPVAEVWVHGLIKGKREQDYNPDSRRRDAGTYKQASVACYGYLKPGKPPEESADIKPSYEYWDTYEQRVKRVGKGYLKVPIWELPPTLPVPEGWTVEEAWSEWVGSEARRKMLAIIGPLSKQQNMVEKFFRETDADEDRWQAGVWELYELAAQLQDEANENARRGTAFDYWQDVWTRPEFQEKLDQLFPRSYQCRRFGQRYKCQFENICFEREGWAHPLTLYFEDPTPGQYVERRPHHQAELQQAIARGLLPPEEGVAEVEGETET